MRQKQIHWMVIGFAIGMLSLAACAPAGPDFPIGFYVNENGNEEIEFNEDGTFSYFLGQATTPEVSGRYSIDGDTFTLEEDDAGVCVSPGTSTWSYDGANLVFRVIEDECEERRGSIGQRWTIQQ